jgi:16S rRNA (adenine1518-N6/adenine1519-N6)-dimethyltransferase|tara:strand:- start:196 stop:981 length:786 start_codon:yes stop_codon:yes gene_type:complete
VIKAKKSLGQNFLIDDNVINKILDITDIQKKDVLEIGPGTGNLTSAILKKNPNRLLVVEKDNELAKNLKTNFDNTIEVINDDILNLDESSLSNTKLIVFGNLPYNISTEILCRWILNIKENYWFEYLILMFQKEVADRIIAKFNTKNYGRLSILANWILEIEKICDVKPTSFSPVPKVDSSVLFFKPKKSFFKFNDPKNLEKITRIFFMHRRKMVKKPYNQLFDGNTEIASRLKIDLNLRPQNLDFETYFKIVNEYEKLKG